MRYAWIVALAALVAWLCMAPDAAAQTVLDAGQGTQVLLMPVTDESGRPLSATAADPAIAPPVHGVVGFDFGFFYLRPDWNNGSFTQLIPPNVVNPFPNLGDVNDLDHEFAFVPRITLNYAVNDSQFGVQASGYFLELDGDLKRTVTNNGVTGSVTAVGAIDIIVANLIEGTWHGRLSEFGLFDEGGCFNGLGIEDTILDFSLGFRYSTLRQSYTATITSTPINGKTEATQEFSGVGITVSMETFYPLSDETPLFLYTSTRGSLLMGQNTKDSTAILTIPANPAASFSNVLHDKETEMLPVGEMELGIAWARDMTSDPMAAAGIQGPLLRVQLGVVAQVWGKAGMLSANQVPPSFQDDRLVLYGFTIMAGVEH